MNNIFIRPQASLSEGGVSCKHFESKFKVQRD